MRSSGLFAVTAHLGIVCAPVHTAVCPTCTLTICAKHACMHVLALYSCTPPGGDGVDEQYAAKTFGLAGGRDHKNLRPPTARHWWTRGADRGAVAE